MAKQAIPHLEHTVSINNFEMFYQVYGTGAPLLLLHGFTGSSVDALTAFEQLGKTHQLIIPDLRGHGRSTNPSKQFTHRQAALDMFALLEHLNIDHCHAVGLSCGGNTLLHMAIQRADIIKAMTLVSATTHFPKQAREIMRQFTVAAKSGDEWKAMRRIHHHGDEQIKLLWQQAHDFHRSFDDMNLSAEQLATITAKTLIVQGDRDPIYPIEISVEMYRSIPNAYLWVVPGGGHGPISADNMTTFIDTIRDFI